MFDIPVFLVKCAIVIAANIVAIPKLVAYSAIYRDARTQKISLLAALTKGILLSLLACAVGSYTAPRVGVSSPFIESLIHFDRPYLAFWKLLLPAAVSALSVLLGLVFLHIIFVRRHITTERYFSIPLSAKILLEGVVEEFVYRWGLMTVVARILDVEFFDANAAMVLAIILAAVGSSLSHVSDLSRLNFDRISMALLAVILVNFWGALCYGWLFWKYGLTAAILCHVLVIWVSVLTYRLQHFFAFQESDGRL